MTEVSPPPQLLLVEHDACLRERLAGALTTQGCAVWTAGNNDEAVRVIGARACDYLVVEPGGDTSSGRELIRRLKAGRPRLQILVFTSYMRSAGVIESLQSEGVSYLQKPADAEDVLDALGLRVGSTATP